MPLFRRPSSSRPVSTAAAPPTAQVVSQGNKAEQVVVSTSPGNTFDARPPPPLPAMDAREMVPSSTRTRRPSGGNDGPPPQPPQRSSSVLSKDKFRIPKSLDDARTLPGVAPAPAPSSLTSTFLPPQPRESHALRSVGEQPLPPPPPAAAARRASEDEHAPATASTRRLQEFRERTLALQQRALSVEINCVDIEAPLIEGDLLFASTSKHLTRTAMYAFASGRFGTDALALDRSLFGPGELVSRNRFGPLYKATLDRGSNAAPLEILARNLPETSVDSMTMNDASVALAGLRHVNLQRFIGFLPAQGTRGSSPHHHHHDGDNDDDDNDDDDDFDDLSGAIGRIQSVGTGIVLCLEYGLGVHLNEYFRMHPRMQRASEADLLQIGTQVSGAMTYLASRRVVHRSLTAASVLVVRSGHYKVANTGVAYLSNDTRWFTTDPFVRHMAPEVIEHAQFSLASDAWALAVTLWEILTHCAAPPLPHLDQVHAAGAILTGRLSLPLPNASTTALPALISAGTDSNIDERLTSITLHSQLEYVLSNE